VGGKLVSQQNMPQPKHGKKFKQRHRGGGGQFRQHKKGSHGGHGGGGRVECPMCGATVPNLAQHVRERHDYSSE
jgi:hypothetical protein